MLFCILLNLKQCFDFISTASRASLLRDMRSARLKLFCRESSQQDNLQFLDIKQCQILCQRELGAFFQAMPNIERMRCFLPMSPQPAASLRLSINIYLLLNISIISLFSARQPINFLKRHRSLCGPLQGLS